MGELAQTIPSSDPRLVLEWKWGTAVWSASGLICALGATQDHLKINFFKGATLPDPDKLFNAGLEAKTSRAIDLYEGDKIDQEALKRLVKEAVAKSVNK